MPAAVVARVSPASQGREFSPEGREKCQCARKRRHRANSTNAMTKGAPSPRFGLSLLEGFELTGPNGVVDLLISKRLWRKVDAPVNAGVRRRFINS